MNQAVTFKLMSYNVRAGLPETLSEDTPLDKRVRAIERNLPRLASIVDEQHADVVALQEIDRNAARSGRCDQAAVFGRVSGLAHRYDECLLHRGDSYGMALLSRYPLRDDVVSALVLPDSGFAGFERSIAQIYHLTVAPGFTLLLINVHLDALETTPRYRLAQVRFLMQHLDGLSATPPCVIVGDYNTEPGSPTLDLLQKQYNFRLVGKVHAGAKTWNTSAPSQDIDHVCIRGTDAIGIEAEPLRVLVDKRDASDHLPIVTTITLFKRH